MFTGKSSEQVVVLGGTGKQGGEVVQELLERKKFNAAIITRNPESAKAKELLSKGVQVIKVDLDKVTTDELANVFQGSYGVFSVQEMGKNEVKQGIMVADACKKANVQHLVYSSVNAAEKAPNVPHFHSKYLIEQHIKQLNLPNFTILRPTCLMDNFDDPQMQPKYSSLMFLIKPTTKLQWIACKDIGIAANKAFEEPKKYAKKTVSLAGDNLTGTELAQVFSRVLGRDLKYKKMPSIILRLYSNEMYKMADFFEKTGYDTNIPEVKKEFPQLRTMEQWLKENEWDKKPPPKKSTCSIM
ncbi:unnamed protein product [Didymodactylos carnosus]|uniref:NmrA-like family domain-containing protein 1 n=1 Tax=Didymodactylos carnosus TaxID=1234261 RepID=A0A814D4T1_9BILA|nr:unnamed protein product [Didymodactylos carnosus]CAF0949457.1 unnamed protein product [Didymodactylos carnosus]CAF3703729.1 unnamed protein product [Didymodactylos carnosus]CAF3725233.1 unnamed protein product [Didymodactylos carnosus]